AAPRQLSRRRRAGHAPSDDDGVEAQNPTRSISAPKPGRRAQRKAISSGAGSAVFTTSSRTQSTEALERFPLFARERRVKRSASSERPKVSRYVSMIFRPPGWSAQKAISSARTPESERKEATSGRSLFSMRSATSFER